MKPLNRTILLLVTAMAFSMIPLAAGPTLDCQCRSWNDQVEGWVHDFDLSGTLAYKCDTAGCHYSNEPNGCSSEHTGCGSLLLGSAEWDQGLGSERSLTALAMKSNVVYNAERQALQVLDCAGQVSQSVRVPDHFVRAVAAAVVFQYLYA